MTKEEKIELAMSKDISLEVLDKLIEDTDPEIRQIVADNPKTPPVILDRLSFDPDDKVRLNVALNNQTWTGTLLRLTGDQDEIIRDMALSMPKTWIIRDLELDPAILIAVEKWLL